MRYIQVIHTKPIWSYSVTALQNHLIIEEDEVWERVCFANGAGMARSIHGLQLPQISFERYLKVQTEEHNCAISINTKRVFGKKVSLYRAFSGLTNRYRNSPRKKDDEAILVNAIHQEGSEEQYQTMFMMSSEEGGEYELVFFRRLDDEFNKVVNFYRKKVEQVMEEADELSRQMNVLIALRVKVDKPVVKFAESSVINLVRNGISSSSSVFHPANGKNPGN